MKCTFKFSAYLGSLKNVKFKILVCTRTWIRVSSFKVYFIFCITKLSVKFSLLYRSCTYNSEVQYGRWKECNDVLRVPKISVSHYSAKERNNFFRMNNTVKTPALFREILPFPFISWCLQYSLGLVVFVFYPPGVGLHKDQGLALIW